MLSFEIAAELWSLFKNPPIDSAWHNFIKKINSNSWMECWIWQGNLSVDGYGRFRVGKRNRIASRLIAEWTYGVPLPKWEADHIVCNQPACVNPLHLRFCTGRENSMRSNNFAAKYARSTHCPKGHERTPENQSQAHKNYYGEHVRACAECKRERARIWAAGNYDTKKEEMRTKAREWQAAKRAKMTEAELEASRQYQRNRWAKKKALKEASG